MASPIKAENSAPVVEDEYHVISEIQQIPQFK
jgi:hypothetical protein